MVTSGYRRIKDFRMAATLIVNLLNAMLRCLVIRLRLGSLVRSLRTLKRTIRSNEYEFYGYWLDGASIVL